MSLCDRTAQPPGVPPCDDAVRGRISLLETTLRAIAHVDMKNAPYLAKEKIFHELHPTFLPRPKLNKKAAPKSGRIPLRPAPPRTLDGQAARRQHPRQLCARSSTG